MLERDFGLCFRCNPFVYIIGEYGLLVRRDCSVHAMILLGQVNIIREKTTAFADPLTILQSTSFRVIFQIRFEQIC